MNTLNEWYEIREQLKVLQDKEKELRLRIMSSVFPDAKEGINNYPLEGGYVLKGTRVISRKIDEASLSAIADQLASAGVSVDSLIRYKPELSVSQYKKLSAEQRMIFDQALIIKDGLPQLDIVLPKK